MRWRQQVPGPQSPSDQHGPAQTCTLATRCGQREDRGAGSPLSTQTSPDPHRLPELVWAPSWGQMGAYCPRWARPGSEGLADHLLRGSQQDGEAPGVRLGAQSSGSPPARSGSGDDSARTAGASSPPPRAGLPTPDPPPSLATHRPLLVSMATGQCCAQTSSLGGRQGTPSFCTTPR